jgi:hypothetical protein
MAPYLAKFSQERAISFECRTPTTSLLQTCAERQHKNVHQLKFKMKTGARKKTSYDKGNTQFSILYNIFLISISFFIFYSKGIATDFFQKNIVLPSMEDILNPSAATLEVVNVMCISSELYLTRLVSKYRPEYRCLNHPFRKAWKQVTKVCNAQMKVSLIKTGDIDGTQIPPNAFCYPLALNRA